jgi:hypothetical protein
MRRFFIRNLEAPDLFLAFLISAVGSILGIRFFLHLTGYPQIAGGGLHIAHMLWGGLLLLIAVVLLLGFLDRHAQQVAAVIAGIGWGMFIDELGKFITRDSNYFFAPTVALIYVSFVALYLALQAVASTTQLSDDEYEANAMRVLEEAVQRGLTVDRRTRVQEYLSHTRLVDPIAQALASFLLTVDAAPAPAPSPVQRLHGWIRPQYVRLVRHRSFRAALDLFFGVHIVLGLGQAIALVALAASVRSNPGDILQATSIAQLGTPICSTLAGAMTVAGMVVLPRSRMQAYRRFRSSVLISILLTEFFVFLEAQFAAIPGFLLNLGTLLVLEELIEQERELRSRLAAQEQTRGQETDVRPPEERPTALGA